MAKKVNFDTAQKLDITCRRGDTFTLTLTIKDSDNELQDLTSDQFSMQVRDKASSDGNNGLILSTFPEQEVEFTGSDIEDGPALNVIGTPTPDFTKVGKFILDRGTSATTSSDYGVLTVSANNDQMSLVKSGRYVYDLQRYDSTANTHKTLITGSFTIKEDVSEADN